MLRGLHRDKAPRYALALLLALTGLAAAQPISTNIPAGSYTSPLQISGNPTVVTNSGTFTFDTNTVPPTDPGAYILVTSSTPDGDTGANAASAGYATLINNDAVGAMLGGNFSGYRVLLWLQITGGDGGPGASDSDNGGNGGNATAGLSLLNGGLLSLTNDAPVALPAAGAVLQGTARGGDGGDVPNNGFDIYGNPIYNGGRGGTGGNAGESGLTTQGAIIAGAPDAPITGDVGLTGILMQSLGGHGGTGSIGEAGGWAGGVSIVSSAPVTLYWASQNASSTNQLFGIRAEAIGGDGSGSQLENFDGGDGGSTSGGTVTLDITGDVTVVSANANPVTGAGLAALNRGGDGGHAFTSSDGGTGGSVGPGGTNAATAVNLTGAFVTTSGDNLDGIRAWNLAGRGGRGGTNDQNYSNGGAGGAAGALVFNLDGTGQPAAVTTDGTNAAGVTLLVRGGDGGRGTDFNDEGGIFGDGAGGNGGAAGEAARLTANLSGHSSITTSGAGATALQAVSHGGFGGFGGGFTGGVGNPGSGGAAGAGGDVSVNLGTGGSITTAGTNATAVIARSAGGLGGYAGGESEIGGDGTPGGAGGDSGNVGLVVEEGFTITTDGDGAHGLIAQSVSGAGGRGGSANDVGGGTSGSGGAGGNTGTVSVLNQGTIDTAGSDAIAVLAQAVSGAGGAGGDVSGIVFVQAANGSSSGLVGPVSVTNTGTIRTGPASPPPLSTNNSPAPGQASHGILAQSIAGSGGAAGNADLAVDALGGNATNNQVTADGGAVGVFNSGSITTTGPNALGILAQSVGGGGGDGGSSTSLLVGIGGAGGAGGAGGEVTVSATGGSVLTGGGQSHAVVAQSIGGGGGNAGSATAIDVAVSVAIGGTAGGGGDGGTAQVNLTNTAITTENTKAVGVVVQSVGGGGGTGGAGSSYSDGFPVSVGVSVGGQGGSGGFGTNASATISGTTIRTGISATNPPNTPTNTLPVDSFGVVVQSIGGGGGNGGSAVAEALAIAPPIPFLSASLPVTVAVGGTAGSGGDGGNAAVTLDQGTRVITAGQGSHGVVVQGIGGGGGNGGDASTLAATFAYGRLGFNTNSPFSTTVSLNVNVGLGGGGGAGGDGGTVQAAIGEGGTNSAGVLTYGDYANALVAQSIGGGGGNGGFGSSTTQAFGNSDSLGVQVTLGGTGAVGGVGNFVEAILAAGSELRTLGSGANGIVAQSIGGGGGTSQGGSVNVGAQYTADGATIVPSGNVNIGFGQTGGGGNHGGEANVTVDGTIRTFGGDSVGVLAQSIGGGGGVGGSAGSDASADNPVIDDLTAARKFASGLIGGTVTGQVTLGLDFGGTGGTGSAGGAANVTGAGSVTTSGDWAHGIVSQSIGGGGGKGGTATGRGSGSLPTISLNLVGGFGGSGGNGGEGGGAYVGLGDAAIITGAATGQTNTAPTGYSAFGVLVQSIGGGGGLGADGSDAATGVLTLGGSRGGEGGAAGPGGSAIFTAVGTTITTARDASHGAVIQSVGGSGGISGAGSSAFLALGPLTNSMSLSVGGGSSASGSGGLVEALLTNATITTHGTSAFGLLVQSVGGGGGLGAAQNTATNATLNTAPPDGGTYVALGGLNDASSDGGPVTLALAGSNSVATSGLGAHAIIAQTVGGGGGIANYVRGTNAPLLSGMLERGVTHGNGGQIDLGIGGSVHTTGAGAFGVLAQSIGAGGGLLAHGGSLHAGSTGSDGSTGSGGAINILQTGTITASGENSIGLFAQSRGAYTGTGSDGPVAITVAGTVTGGSGPQGVGVGVNGGSMNNALVVSAGASVSAASGTAIDYTGLGILNVTNLGTVTGSVSLLNDSSGLGHLVNHGAFNAGPTVWADVTNEGLLSAGLFTSINGNFIQTAQGMTSFGITSVSEFDTLTLQGISNTIDGFMRVILADTYNPQVGDSFALVSSLETVTYNLDELIIDSPLPGLEWASQISGSDYILTVTAIPEPSVLWLLLAAALASAAGLIKRRPRQG